MELETCLGWAHLNALDKARKDLANATLAELKNAAKHPTLMQYIRESAFLFPWDETDSDRIYKRKVARVALKDQRVLNDLNLLRSYLP